MNLMHFDTIMSCILFLTKCTFSPVQQNMCLLNDLLHLQAPSLIKAEYHPKVELPL